MGKSTKKDFTKNVADIFFTDKAEDTPQEVPADLEVPEGYKLIKVNKTERLQLLVRPNVKQGLRKIAFEKGISMNELAGMIFEDYIHQYESEVK